jgi:hypothetical protein
VSLTRLLNYLLYQVGWFACVLGAAWSRPWSGSVLALVLVAVHLGLAPDRKRQVLIMCAAAIVGLVVDSTLLALGVFAFPNGQLVESLPPVWMSVLWIQFATTLHYCLRWLSGRYLTSAILGLAGAPLAFLGGEKLGAISFLPPRALHLALLGAWWCAAIPLLIYVADRLAASDQRPALYRRFAP